MEHIACMDVPAVGYLRQIDQPGVVGERHVMATAPDEPIVDGPFRRVAEGKGEVDEVIPLSGCVRSRNRPDVESAASVAVYNAAAHLTVGTGQCGLLGACLPR